MRSFNNHVRPFAMGRGFTHRIVELEHRRRRITSYLERAVDIFKVGLQRPVDNCNAPQKHRGFTDKPVGDTEPCSSNCGALIFSNTGAVSANPVEPMIPHYIGIT